MTLDVIVFSGLGAVMWLGGVYIFFSGVIPPESRRERLWVAIEIIFWPIALPLLIAAEGFRRVSDLYKEWTR